MTSRIVFACTMGWLHAWHIGDNNISRLFENDVRARFNDSRFLFSSPLSSRRFLDSFSRASDSSFLVRSNMSIL